MAIGRAKLTIFIFFGFFLVGGVGFAIFSLAERYWVLSAKVRWAGQQEKILTRGLGDLTRQRNEFERDQLDFAKRVADQEKRLKRLEQERQSLIEGIRRIAERNRELSLKEEAAEFSRSEAMSFQRDINSLTKELEKTKASNLKLKDELKSSEKKLLESQKNSDRTLSQEVSRLKIRYDGSLRHLESELEELRSASRDVSTLANERDALKQELAALKIRYDGSLRRLESELEELRPASRDVSTLRRERGALQQELEALKQKETQERATYFYNLGVTYTRGGMFRDAARMYEQALKENPNDADSHHNLGILYEAHLRRREEAVKHFQRFLELSPDEKEKGKVLRWIDEVHHSIGHTRRTSIESSRDAIEKLINTTP